MRSVVVAIGDERGCPGEPGAGTGEIGAHGQALVAVDRRGDQRGQGAGVGHEPAQEVVGQLRLAEPAGIGRVDEDVLVAIPQREVEVTAVAGQVAERLGHVGRDGAVPLGHLVGHHLEERVAVGRVERVRVLPVDLELGGRVFVIRGVRLPAQLLQVAHQRAQVAQVRGEALEVVARLLERVVSGGVERGDRSVGTAGDEHVLGLDTDLHRVAGGGQAIDLVAEGGPRAVRPVLAVDLDVARKPGHSGLPRHERVGREVRHADEVMVVRALAHSDGRRAGEPGTAAQEHVQGAGRNALASRRAVDVHPLREHVGDAVGGETPRDGPGGGSSVPCRLDHYALLLADLSRSLCQ